MSTSMFGKKSLLLHKMPYDEYFRQVFTTLNLSFSEKTIDDIVFFTVFASAKNHTFSTFPYMKNGGVYFYSKGGALLQNILSNKFTTEKFLKINNIKTIDSQEVLEVSEIHNDYPFPVFVKPERGSVSEGCKKIDNKGALLQHITELFKDGYGSVLIQPFIEKSEYRVVMSCGKLIYIYKKGKPMVVGDGISSLRDLIGIFNQNVYGAFISPEMYTQYDENLVLEKNKELILDDVTAFKRGGTVLELFDPEDIPQKTHDFFQDIVKKLGLEDEVLGFDIFGKNIGDMQEIIEINTDPGNFGLPEDWTYNIYKEIFKI